jgi:predicted amidohydrolase
MGCYYNRLIWMLPNEQYGWYDKRHLFGFASEHEYYSSGNKRLIASVKGWKVNLQVCYDLRFPVWARQQNAPEVEIDEEDFGGPQFVPQAPAAPEYDILIYVANWPERRAHAWKTLLQARAIENQCYVVGVNRVGQDGKGINYTGDSMVIDPLGEVLHTGQDEHVHTLKLQKGSLEEIRAKFPFLKDGDSFLIV